MIQGQGQRGILEMKLPLRRLDYMFHAHVSEFAELGWTGFFRVGAPRAERRGRRGAHCKLPWGGHGSAA